MRVLNPSCEFGDLGAVGRDLGDPGAVGGPPIQVDEMSDSAGCVRVESESVFQELLKPEVVWSPGASERCLERFEPGRD